MTNLTLATVLDRRVRGNVPAEGDNLPWQSHARGTVGPIRGVHAY